MIYSSVLKNAAQGGGGNLNLDNLRVSAGQETDKVRGSAATFRFCIPSLETLPVFSRCLRLVALIFL